MSDDAPSFRIAIADKASPWRERLAAMYRDDGHTVEVTDDGYEAVRILSETEAPIHAMILGQNLVGVSGLDALYLAHVRHMEEGRKRHEWGVRTLLLRIEVALDTKLRSLLRSRGVTAFLKESHEPRSVFAQTSMLLYAEFRAHPRYQLEVQAFLKEQSGDDVTPGLIRDISAGGARFETTTEAAGKSFLPDAALDLSLSYVAAGRTLRFECPVEVRNLVQHKGDPLLVAGLRFQDMSDSMRAALDAILADREKR